MTVNDNFNRADSASLGANWGTMAGIGSLQVISNTAGAGTAAAHGNIWTADVFGADQHSTITLAAPPSPTFPWGMAFVRYGGVPISGYSAGFDFSDFGNYKYRIEKWDNYTQTTLIAHASQVAVNGDVIDLLVVGDLLTLTVNGIAILSVTDNSYATGIAGFTLIGGASAVDAWSGGDPPTAIAYSIGMTSFLVEHPCTPAAAAPMLVFSSIKSIPAGQEEAASILAVPPADAVMTLSPPPPPPAPPFPGPAQRYLVDTATATSVFWYHEHRLYASFNGKTYCRDMLHQENGWTDCGYGYVNARVVTSRFNFPYIAFLSANLTPAGYGDRATGVVLTHRSMTPENLYVQIVPNKVIRLRPFDGPDIRRASDKQGLLLKVWGSVDCGLRSADWNANPPRVIGELVGRTSNGYEERAPIYAGIYKDGMILEQGFTPAFTSNLLECDLVFNSLVRDVEVSQATMEFLVLN